MKKLSSEDFISKCMEIHKDRYLYDNLIYINMRTKVKIICKIHGEFTQSPNSHINGSGCSNCSDFKNRNTRTGKKIIKLNTISFIEKCVNIHGDKYDYSGVRYINELEKINIICMIHGEFSQRAKNHKIGQGCPLCSSEKNRLTFDEFLEKSIIIHNNKYDYTKSIYINMISNINIVCKKHGEFKTTPFKHLNSKGCKKCSYDSISYTNEEFIIKSSKVHSNKYDYSKTEYNGIFNEIVVICNKHGEFITKPNTHLRGQGCSKCNISKGENIISNYLDNKSIKYTMQKTFDDCLSTKNWKLKFDFYLPEQSICIEYDGLQHFKPIDYFGGVKSFNELKQRDSIKDKYCLENNIKLIRIPFDKYYFIDDILISEIIY
jgi:hypothetical protein